MFLVGVAGLVGLLLGWSWGSTMTLAVNFNAKYLALPCGIT